MGNNITSKLKYKESVVKFSYKYGVTKAAIKFGECKRTILVEPQWNAKIIRKSSRLTNIHLRNPKKSTLYCFYNIFML